MFIDPFAVKVGADEQSYLGDLIPFLGAGLGAVQGYLNHHATHLHPLIRMTQFFIFSFIFQLIFFPLFVWRLDYFSFDPVNGAFGWLSNSYNFFMVILIVSPITGILGNIGFFSSYSYWPMQIVAAAILTEPFIGQILGVLLGQDQIPGTLTIVGLLIITVGFVIASYGIKMRQIHQLDEIVFEMEEVRDVQKFKEDSEINS
jgi:drug/metabolite transporter (DMT)-like permease